MNFLEWSKSYQFFPEKKHGEVKKPKKRKEVKIDPQIEIIEDIAMMHEDLRYADERKLTKEYQEHLVKMVNGARESSAKMYVADRDFKKGVTVACVGAGATLAAAIFKIVYADRVLSERDLDPEDDVFMRKRRSQFSAINTFWKNQ